jgi:hypothetical protein
MKSFLAGAVLAALHASAAVAAPRAESAMECGVAADMAVVADSLAREQIDHPKASAIMARIYDVAGSQRGKDLMRDIIDAAYSAGRGATAPSSETSGQKFAEELFTTCMKSGGDMDRILGRRS